MGTTPTGTTTVLNEPEEVMVDANEKKSVLDGHLKSVSKKVRSLLQRADRSDVEARYEISVGAHREPRNSELADAGRLSGSVQAG